MIPSTPVSMKSVESFFNGSHVSLTPRFRLSSLLYTLHNVHAPQINANYKYVCEGKNYENKPTYPRKGCCKTSQWFSSILLIDFFYGRRKRKLCSLSFYNFWLKFFPPYFAEEEGRISRRWDYSDDPILLFSMNIPQTSWTCQLITIIWELLRSTSHSQVWANSMAKKSTV